MSVGIAVDLADELERLLEHDAVRETAELRHCAERLAGVPGAPAAVLSPCLTTLAARLEQTRWTDHQRHDVEGVVYPRLWKLLEAVRDGLPEGEQLNRLRALEQRLARLPAPS